MTSRQFTRSELESRNHKQDAVFVIDNVVYDVTQFLDDHPGGAEALLDNAGKDASQCYHDVGHTEDAQQWRQRFAIGEVVPADRREVAHREGGPRVGPTAPLTTESLARVCMPPLAFAALGFFLYSYLFS